MRLEDCDHRLLNNDFNKWAQTITKYNANNERIKRRYLTFLKQAKGQNEASIDAVAKALVRFESYSKHKDFRAFHFEQAVGFKKHLANQLHYKTGKPLSLATLNSTVRYLKTFIGWLSQEVGYKSCIKYSDASISISQRRRHVLPSPAVRNRSLALSRSNTY